MQPETYGTDAEALTGAAAGEPAAVRALLDAIGPIVYGFIFARVGGDEQTAQDLTQETLIEAVRSAHTFRGEAAVSTWCCTIARRRIARHFEAERKQAVARAGLSVVDGAPEPDPVARRDQIVRALGRLPAVHRQVLVLKYLDDMTVEEIAGEIGRTPVQVQSLLQRARAGLRRELDGDDD